MAVGIASAGCRRLVRAMYSIVLWLSAIVIPAPSAVLWLFLMFKAYKGAAQDCRTRGPLAERQPMIAQ